MTAVHVRVEVERQYYPGLLLEWRRIETGAYKNREWHGRVLYVTGDLPYRLLTESWIPAERIKPIQ